MNFKAFVVSIICVFSFLIIPSAIAADLVSHAPADAQAYIIEPADGATVPETFTVKFGLSGMDLAPAGVERENTGHHHLLIDQSELPNLNASLPSTEQIRHFGKAQTETELTLSPGKHTLQLVLGNYLHIPHDNPVVSEAITIEVK
ncbi:DUF4399 domain-containing protein [Pleurocapsales cyanobacterium LEGE 10410]|nr:DUF4399 domain-containing protein [Pleurocapsales cyanobacterium LEGE 10410]